MTFEEFKGNVEAWAAARGIYEHSTPEAQLLKTVSEVGELADAIIKNDLAGLKDAIGDVTVCLVNHAKMVEQELSPLEVRTEVDAPSNIENLIGYVLEDLSEALSTKLYFNNLTIDRLQIIAGVYGLDFMDCCEAAWNAVKDRTGRMVPGGAFVKDE